MIRTLQLSLLSPLALVLILGISTSVHAQNADIGIRVDADGALNASSSAGDAGSEDMSSQTDVGADATTGASFNLNRFDASVSNSSGAVIDATSVNTKSDLEAYAAAALHSGSSFESVTVTEDSVVLSFKENARLLGIIPHTITSRIEVDGDGSVRVIRPWYRFLVAGISPDTSANLEARITQVLQENRMEGNAALSARAQAVILAEVIAATNSSVAQSTDTTASVEASSDTNVVVPN